MSAPNRLSWVIMLVGIVALVVAIALVIWESDEEPSRGNDDEGESITAQREPSIYDLLTTKNKYWDVQFYGPVEKLAQIGGRKNALGVFYRAILIIKNIGVTASTYNLWEFTLIDDNGREFSADQFDVATNNRILSYSDLLNPGISVYAIVLFDIPKRANIRYFRFHYAPSENPSYYRLPAVIKARKDTVTVNELGPP